MRWPTRSATGWDPSAPARPSRGLAASPVAPGATAKRSDAGSARLGVGDRLLAHPLAQGVLELGLLDEQVVLGRHRRRRLRALEVEAQPLLDAGLAGPGREV